jgi:hypothetical protein
VPSTPARAQTPFWATKPWRAWTTTHGEGGWVGGWSGGTWEMSCIWMHECVPSSFQLLAGWHPATNGRFPLPALAPLLAQGLASAADSDVVPPGPRHGAPAAPPVPGGSRGGG